MPEPFTEVTHHTPSPAQDDGADQGRRHSPWTAARLKKKTRCIKQDEVLTPQAVRAAQGHQENVVGAASNCHQEFSLADGLSPASEQCGSQPRTSPPIDRGREADVHPAKAYIVDQQVMSPNLQARWTNTAAGAPPRSPLWSGRTAVQEVVQDVVEAGDLQPRLEHSSSAPSNILLDKFDALHEEQQAANRQTSQQHGLDEAYCQPAVPAKLPAGQAAAAATRPPAGKRRGLMARRRSWGGAENASSNNGTTPAGSMISRLTSSDCSSNDSAVTANGSWLSSALDIACIRSMHQGSRHMQQESTGTADIFQLNSRSPPADSNLQAQIGSVQQQRHNEKKDFTVPLQQYGLGRQHAAYEHCLDGDDDRAPGSSASWFEQQLLEAADEGDLQAAQHLWMSLQAAGLTPTRKALNNYLLCYHYGGGDPHEAEQVVRDVCSSAGIEPDNTITRLLEAIDISWQQLHCGF